MTPQQGAKKLRAKATALRREVGKSLTLSARNGRDIGRDLSGGPFSLQQLAEMGHPYAVRHAQMAARAGVSRRTYVKAVWGTSSLAAAYIINRQSGEFQRAWKAQGASAFRGGLRSHVVNRDRAAGFLAGKDRPRSRMIRRPIDEQVVKLLRPIMEQNVSDAVGRAVRA